MFFVFFALFPFDMRYKVHPKLLVCIISNQQTKLPRSCNADIADHHQTRLDLL